MRSPKFTGYVFCALALGAVSPAAAQDGAQDSAKEPARPGLHSLQPQHHTDMNALEHQFHMAGRQSMLTQKMSKELLLVALGVEPEKNLTNLKSSRELFGQTLAGLTHGDEELKLVPSTDESVADRLQYVNLVWPLFDEAISEAISASEITKVSRAAELSETLLNAMRDTGTAYGDVLKVDRPYSILALSMEGAETLGMLTEKMAKEFLLIAYGHEPERNRQSLDKTYAEIENIIGGLLDGNVERQLLSAPTPAIRESLIVAQEHLRQLKPTILAAVSGDPIGDEQIQQVVQHNEPILAQIEPLIALYQAM
jgi:hypothetical protein